MIYRHEARGVDQFITSTIDAHVQGEQRKDGEGPTGALAPRANGTEDQQRLSRSPQASDQNRL